MSLWGDVHFILGKNRDKTEKFMHFLEDAAQKTLMTSRRFITVLPCHTKVDDFHLPTPRVPGMGITVVKSPKRSERSVKFYTSLRKLQIIYQLVGMCHKKTLQTLCAFKWLQTVFLDILLANKKIHLRIKCIYGIFICHTVPDGDSKVNFPLDYKYRTAVKI